MGGNAKHMPHIWEHLDHTFTDLLGLLEDLNAGRIAMTEKFDGINIHFRVDAEGVVRFSRNDSDRKKGGRPFSQMLNDYATHPARQTIIEGIRSIDEHFSEAWWPLGFSGRNWINAEIIFTPRPQLLKYDENAIVLHEVVTYLPTNGKMVDTSLQGALEKVSAKLPVTTVTGFKWMILPPQPVSFISRDGEGFLTEARNRLKTCVQSCGLSGESTLRDFLRESLFRGQLAALDIDVYRRQKLADHISGKQKHRLIDLKKGLKPSIAKQVSELGQAKNRDKVHREAMRPIINTVSAYGAERLVGVTSSLISDGGGEVGRIQEEIDTARTRIYDSDDLQSEQRRILFEEFMHDFESLGGKPVAIEGITFVWKDKKTKLTGTFSTLNQALGVDRYGRGGIGPTPQKKAAFNLAEWFGFM